MSPFCKMDFFLIVLQIVGRTQKLYNWCNWWRKNLTRPESPGQPLNCIASVTPLSAVPQIKRGLNSELQLSLSLSLTLWTQVFKCPTSKWSDFLWQPRKDILAHPRLRLMKLSPKPIYRLVRADLIWFNLESGLSGRIIPFTEIGLIKLNRRMI